MGAMVVVVILPLSEFVVEDVGVVYDDAVEQGVELFGVDAVGALHLAVKARGAGFDVAVADPFVENVIVERRLEFGAVVSLDDLHREGQPLKHVVNELDRGFLVATRVDAQHT